MSSGVARGRLSEERRAWRKNHPHGFVAKPETAPDGSVNLMVWHCTIPGKAGTDWEGGNYPLTLYFTEDYPSKAPKCMFPKDFFHLNVYGSGMVCLSILNEDGWRPSITVRQILVGVQDLLHQPNPASPANYDEYELFVKDPAEYQRRVRQQAKQQASKSEDNGYSLLQEATQRPDELRSSPETLITTSNVKPLNQHALLSTHFVLVLLSVWLVLSSGQQNVHATLHNL